MRLIFSFLTILLLWNGASLAAQQAQRTTVVIDFPQAESAFVQSGTVPFDQKAPFFSYFIVWPTGDLAPAMRFSADNKHWTDWQAMPRDEHNDEKGITELQFGEPTYRHFYTPGDDIAAAAVSPPPANEPLACPCAQPPVSLRSAWCPAGDCPENSSPTPTVVTHLIVHHSAGSNTSGNWAAVVRAIWDYHVNGNGWSDIGYNYLVDPNGVLYEGRGNNILGAHFCAKNGNTMGVCVMGDFTNVTPTENAITSLQRLLAWKACDRDIDPLGSAFHPSSGLNLKNISGHRDGCSTACPGDAFYPLLPEVRQGTANEIATGCIGVVSVDEQRIPATALRLSPNPARDVLQLELNGTWQGELQVQVLDLTQRTLLSEQSQKNGNRWTTQLDVSALPAGTYLLRIDVDAYRGVWKVVKQ
jgi:hypothetical protein